MTLRALYMFTALLMVGACTTSGTYNYQDYLQKKELRALQTKENFQHCYGYGCRKVADVTLSDAEWQSIASGFQSIQTAEKERAQIARAIGIFEEIVGEKTGTKADRAGTYSNIAPLSHDCVDESVNTTIYLALLKQNGLLKSHTMHAPSARVPILQGRLGFVPHQTASITDTATNQRYAVDSWFHDNGHPAEIVAFEAWKKGWNPSRNQRKNENNL
jgi:hypothetical protein